MTRYAVLMRGINLGSTNKISMPSLRTLVEGLGYAEVRTYINSGNLLLSTSQSADRLTGEITKSIKAEFGFSIDVTARTEARLRTILAANPYPDGNPSQVTVAFLTSAPGAEAQRRVAEVAAEHEPFTFAGTEVYVNYTHGIGNSPLAAQFSKIIGVSATVRNVRTVGKLVEMLDNS